MINVILPTSGWPFDALFTLQIATARLYATEGRACKVFCVNSVVND